MCKNQPTPLKHLIKNNIQITTIKDIAETLAETFSTNSSSKNSKTEFNKYKATKEKQKLNFQSDNPENYNKSFTLSELQEANQKYFTDGSKSNFGTGCGVVLHKKSLKKCLPKETSIFSAEIYAINRALDLISTSNSKKFIIHSDSISVLQSLKYTN